MLGKERMLLVIREHAMFFAPEHRTASRSLLLRQATGTHGEFRFLEIILKVRHPCQHEYEKPVDRPAFSCATIRRKPCVPFSGPVHEVPAGSSFHYAGLIPVAEERIDNGTRSRHEREEPLA